MSGDVEVPRVQDLGGVILLDTVHGGLPGTIGVFLLPLEGGSFALIETGPGSTSREVRAGIEEAGYELAGLEHILLTHIHLDHAGAAGEFSRETGALVHVHHRGAPHLSDPSRLLESAGRIYGEQMQSLWGSMEPVPESTLRTHFDGDLLRLPGHVIEAIDTPGHAGHHLAFLLDGDTLLTGDVANIRLPPADLIRPALPPPEIDLEVWDASIAKIRSFVPERLLLTHFGEIQDADEHLAAVPERNRLWAEELLHGLRAGEDQRELTARIAGLAEREFQAAGIDEALAERYRVSSNAAMTAMGVARYWRKKHPEALATD